METLQMQTFPGTSVDISPARYKTGFSQLTPSPNKEKTLKIKEFISWAVCFGIISGITGLLKFLKVGITMDTVTSVLFYLSLGGLIYFLARIIMMAKKPALFHPRTLHELN